MGPDEGRAGRRGVTLTREQLANRDELMRAGGRFEAAEGIARAIEAEADDEASRPGQRDSASRAIETWLREAARIARSHAVRPAVRAVEATEAPAGSPGHPTTKEEPT